MNLQGNGRASTPCDALNLLQRLSLPKIGCPFEFSKKEIEKQKINNRTRTNLKSNNLRDFLTLVFSNSGHYWYLMSKLPLFIKEILWKEDHCSVVYCPSLWIICTWWFLIMEKLYKIFQWCQVGVLLTVWSFESKISLKPFDMSMQARVWVFAGMVCYFCPVTGSSWKPQNYFPRSMSPLIHPEDHSSACLS